MSCLHVLCETCLKSLLAAAEDEEVQEDNIYVGRGKPQRIIVCPLCKQETMVTFSMYSYLIIKFCTKVKCLVDWRTRVELAPS